MGPNPSSLSFPSPFSSPFFFFPLTTFFPHFLANITGLCVCGSPNVYDYKVGCPKTLCTVYPLLTFSLHSLLFILFTISFILYFRFKFNGNVKHGSQRPFYLMSLLLLLTIVFRAIRYGKKKIKKKK